jgi:antitoxin component YwqK of YwqJK toxin-antitoxin module
MTLMEKQNPSEECFDRNLDLLAYMDPFYAHLIALIQPNKLMFCYTNGNELNLTIRKEGDRDYYHSPNGVEEESRERYASKDIDKCVVIYQYGLGLGHDYIILKEWLKNDAARHVIFMEDDLEVIYYWLHTPFATEMLQDPQVTILCFRDHQQDHEKFFKVHCRFILNKHIMTALPYYDRVRNEDTYLLSYQISFDKSTIHSWSLEVLQGGGPFFNSLYRNIFRLPESYHCNALFGQFANVPAIICGAGPSLHKNIDLLKTLTDRALIFAGGSSLNILNEYGIIPHFGAGVDPNHEQTHRLISNHSFDLPFIYCPRMKSDALNIVNGELLYVSGSGEYDVLQRLEKEMGISSQQINMGHNVVNFATFMAAVMGCNPLIFVGMDLAYTKSQTYAKGIPTHPLWIQGKSPYIFDPQVEIITRKDIYNEPVKTTWQWMTESHWLSKFSFAYPGLKVINATEGGIGFCDVPNMTLDEAARTYFSTMYDFPLWIHEEIQNHPIPLATRPRIWGFINDWKKSLQQCLEYCQSILWELQGLTPEDLAVKNVLVSALYSHSSTLAETLMEEEEAYHFFLRSYIEFYTMLQTRHLHRIHRESTHDGLIEQMKKYTHILIERYNFLVSLLEGNLNILDNAIKQFIYAPSQPLPNAIEAVIPTERIESDQGIYQIEADRLIIEDPELGLSIDVPFKVDLQMIQDGQNGVSLSFYPEGQLKLECTYQEGLLHGPSRSYSVDGKLLGQGWFVDGKRQGKSWRFYLSGKLFGLQRYLNGVKHGIQETFYEDGKLKGSISYKEGVLDGAVLFYYPDSILHRELHYRDGKRHGKEMLWNPNGKLLMEAEYEDGVPVGVARQWSLHGQLTKEVIIQAFPDKFELTTWGIDGQVSSRIVNGEEDQITAYEKMERDTAFIQGTIEAFMSKINQHLAQEEFSDEQKIKNELSDMQGRIKALDKMKKDMTRLFEENKKEIDK